MGLLKKFFNQTRKPGGFLGNVMLNRMNIGHAKLSDWGMSKLPEIAPETVADMGCGGGRNAAVLLKKYPSAKLTAVDYSPLSVERTKKYNARAVSDGRCAVLEASVADLPLQPDMMDFVTAFETIYFWPGLETCFKEIYRILKPGGKFFIVNESDGKDEVSLKFEKIIDGMRTYTPEKIRDALEKAGFSRIEIFHHENKPWIAILADKSGAA